MTNQFDFQKEMQQLLNRYFDHMSQKFTKELEECLAKQYSRELSKRTKQGIAMAKQRKNESQNK